MQKDRKDKIISVYEKDGTTKIGEFVVSAQEDTLVFTALQGLPLGAQNQPVN